MANEEQHIYFIPGNFSDETKVFQGRVRLRYLADAAALAAVLILLQFLIPVTGFEARITMMVCFGAPGFIAGIAGYNGDPVSVAARSFIGWKKDRNPSLYNSNPRLLTETPISVSEKEITARDRIVDTVETLKRRREQRREEIEYIEGETFEFMDDPGISQYISAEDLERRKEAVNARAANGGRGPVPEIMRETAETASGGKNPDNGVAAGEED